MRKLTLTVEGFTLREYLAALGLTVGESLVQVFLTPESRSDVVRMSILFTMPLYHLVERAVM